MLLCGVSSSSASKTRDVSDSTNNLFITPKWEGMSKRVVTNFFCLEPERETERARARAREREREGEALSKRVVGISSVERERTEWVYRRSQTEIESIIYTTERQGAYISLFRFLRSRS
jgi:hypothetical protein